jgi:hypothetical protein
MDITMQLLTTNDANSVFAGLQCLLAICKVYRFKAGDNRADFDKVVQVSFPQLLKIGNSLMNETSLDAGEMLRIVVKSYKHAIFVRNTCGCFLLGADIGYSSSFQLIFGLSRQR